MRKGKEQTDISQRPATVQKRSKWIQPAAGAGLVLLGVLGIRWGIMAGRLQNGLGLLTRTVAYPELLRFYPYIVGASILLVLCGGLLFVKAFKRHPKRTKFCVQCGRPLPEGAAFCVACGQKLAQEGTPEEKRTPEEEKHISE